jgi:hypothetical protein
VLALGGELGLVHHELERHTLRGQRVVRKHHNRARALLLVVRLELIAILHHRLALERRLERRQLGLLGVLARVLGCVAVQRRERRLQQLRLLALQVHRLSLQRARHLLILRPAEVGILRATPRPAA